MAKAVLFDFRGTLADVSEARQAGNFQLYTFIRSRKAEVSLQAFSYFLDKARTHIKEKFAANTNVHNRDLLVTSSLLSMFRVSFNGAELEKLLEKCDNAFIEKTKLYPDADTFLNFIRTKNTKLGVIIDGTSKRERALLAKLGLDKIFDIVVISQEVGSSKSSLVPLASALTQLALPPSEVIVVGDRIDKDIRPANKLGCVSVLIRRGSEQKTEKPAREETPRYIISKLTELANIVD
ncbi:HAD family hydrolase [Candidatus Micrarchaeota archaeon]|nr:HAD family hydrolase [Candidatus Micrarchaeota archaeon]